ncbi:MAG: hypothetical protein ACOWWO_12070 [Peptococcaceae bacterium]
MAPQLDLRKILRGFDGELYSEDGDFLAEVNTFQVQANVTNADYQPAGSPLSVAIMQSYTLTLTLTETVVRDAVLLQKFLDAIRSGQQPVFGFQGKLKGHDDTVSRQIFRSCVPDGAIDLLNVKPGEIINRAWSFRINEPPELQELLGG